MTCLEQLKSMNDILMRELLWSMEWNTDVLNESASFHVTENKIVDLMHDISLGVINFVLQPSISYFCKKYPQFTLNVFNARIRGFDYINQNNERICLQKL